MLQAPLNHRSWNHRGPRALESPHLARTVLRQRHQQCPTDSKEVLEHSQCSACSADSTLLKFVSEGQSLIFNAHRCIFDSQGVKIHGLAMPSRSRLGAEAEKLTLHTYSCWPKFSFETDVIQIKIDDLSTNLCRAQKTTKGTTSRPSCTSLWLVTVQRITAIESRLYGIVCVQESICLQEAWLLLLLLMIL